MKVERVPLWPRPILGFSMRVSAWGHPDLLGGRTHGNRIFREFSLAFDSSHGSSHSDEPAEEE